MKTYTSDFYDLIRHGAISSAKVVIDELGWVPDSVLDVGCGEGHWAAEFQRLGAASVLGVDGPYVKDRAVVPFRTIDFETEQLPEVDVDLAVCLEVIEHLSPAAGDRLLDDLCSAAPVVLFSAATPRQPGDGHINCQWQAHWAQKFAERGYDTSNALALRLWNDDRVEPWYRQNLMLAFRTPAPIQITHLTGSPVISVIHPTIFDWVMP